MPKIVFVQKDGSSQTVDANGGESVMEAAVRAGVNGIVGECGGNSMCATCHVYVDDAWVDRLPKRSEDEDFLLEDAACERTASSRLGCQVVATEGPDELIVHVPEAQY